MRARPRNTRSDPQKQENFIWNDAMRAYNVAGTGLDILKEEVKRYGDLKAYRRLRDIAERIIDAVGNIGRRSGDACVQGTPEEIFKVQQERQAAEPSGDWMDRHAFTKDETDGFYSDILIAAESLADRADVYDNEAAQALRDFAEQMVKKAASLLPVETA